MNIPKWIKVSDRLPEKLTPKIIYGKNSYGNNRTLRAMYVPEFSISTDDYEYSGDCDYHEEKDQYFWPEGWYEWNDIEETHWKIEFKVTHWMELPEPPCCL